LSELSDLDPSFEPITSYKIMKFGTYVVEDSLNLRSLFKIIYLYIYFNNFFLKTVLNYLNVLTEKFILKFD
jgi:hypothetical protein